MKLANPVYRWTGYTDALSNTIASVGRGAVLPVAGRFKIWVHDGTLDYTVEARAFDQSGTRVGQQSFSGEQTTERSGHIDWEAFVAFQTTGWDTGRYQGEFSVRDTILDESSPGGAADSVAWTVDIVDPLEDDDAVLADQTIPETVRAGVPVDYALTFENRTDRDSSIVSTTSTRVDGGEWTESAEAQTFNIPAGEAIQYQFRDVRLSEPGSYEFRLDAVGITWTIDVTDG